MNRFNKPIAVILSIALLVNTFPTEAFALRPIAYKNCLSGASNTTQHQQMPKLLKKRLMGSAYKVKEYAILGLDRAIQVLKPALLLILFLPAVLLLNHIICEYIIATSEPLTVIIDSPKLEKEAMAYFESLSDNLIPNIEILLKSGHSRIILHYSSNEELEYLFHYQHRFFGVLLAELYFLFCYTFKIMKNKWLAAVAMVSPIYMVALQSFDLAKYHGILDYIYIYIAATKISPGDIFALIGIAMIVLSCIKLLVFAERVVDKRARHRRLSTKKEQTTPDSTIQDSLATALKSQNRGSEKDSFGTSADENLFNQPDTLPDAEQLDINLPREQGLILVISKAA